MIELTDEQQSALRNGEAVRVAVPQLGEEIILLSASQYARLREALEDQSEQRVLLRYSMKQASKVARENHY
jgi:hypothetical protein